MADLKCRVARLEEAMQEMDKDQDDLMARVVALLPGESICALYKLLMNGPADQRSVDIISKTPAAVELLLGRRSGKS